MAELEKRQKTVRVNINLPIKLVNSVKEYADDYGIPYTQAYVILLQTAIEQKDTLKKLPSILDGINSLKELSDKE